MTYILPEILEMIEAHKTNMAEHTKNQNAIYVMKR